MKTKENFTAKKISFKKRLYIYVCLLIIFLAGITTYYTGKLPDRYYAFESGIDSFTVNASYPLTSKLSVSEGNYSVDFSFLGIIPIRSVAVEVLSEMSLMAGGQTFGMKMFSSGLIVVGFSPFNTEDGEKTPAFSAGVRIGDIIIAVDGEEGLSNEKFVNKIRNGGGESISLKIKRKEVELTIDVTPQKSINGDYLLGCFVRDSMAGIGTITFINPVDNSFGGLGHGVYDSDSGSLIPLREGSVVGADIYSVIRGEAGSPGELKGIFNETRQIGSLYQNTEVGIFGILSENHNLSGDIYPIALSDEVLEGEATILCTVDENGVSEYSISIDKVVRSSKNTIKNLIITITDEKLIEKTGGIVQGMSGSPIIQNGKIVGAVTHVMVGDSRRGYGILIENMLLIE